MDVLIRRGVAVSLVLAMNTISILGERSSTTYLSLDADTWKTIFAGLAVLVSSVAVGVSFIVYRKTTELSRKIADRTVTIEAQKLLLEINKLFVSDPRLLIIYRPGDEIHDLIKQVGEETKKELSAKAPQQLQAIEPVENFAGKLAALGFMLLNVFEIVFAQMPSGPEYDTWVNYFKDTLKRCPTVCKALELPEAKVIYHPKLMAAYRDWLEVNKKK